MDDGDAVVEAVADGEVVAQVPFMVRVRKDAESLTDLERDRFVSAFAALNNRGLGLFRGFHAMHTEDTNDEAHGLDAFLPWHRAYLLDLERELQVNDPAVTLPDWRSDRPAPNLFSADFIGAPSGPPNPAADRRRGCPRRTRCAPGPSTARRGSTAIRGSRTPGRRRRLRPARAYRARRDAPCCSTPARRTSTTATRTSSLPRTGEVGFRDILEWNPARLLARELLRLHPFAGHCGRGPALLPAALQCRPDLGQWQWHEQRFDGDPARHLLLPRQLRATPCSTRLGHNLHDTMWPWNGETGGVRPVTAPRQPLLASRVVAGPPPTPTVGDLVDFQGQHGGAPCGFDYDDVPFEKRA